MTRTFLRVLFRLYAVRLVLGTVVLGRAWLHRAFGRDHRALGDFCWVARVTVGPPRWIAARIVFHAIDRMRQDGHNAVVDAYRADPASEACASLYTLTGRGPHELWRDVIVLKKSTPEEKGVILLKYARTFYATVALFDLQRLMEHYIFVLEPCWAGYCDPSILMFTAPGHPVIIQCFTNEDYEFVCRIGAPLVPVRLGPADWVDADLFKPPQIAAKEYDLVMVANWAAHKRHAQLFKALKRVNSRRIRVLLIGFPWSGRTADDIRREAATIGNALVQVDVIENLPATEVANQVGRCKVFVFLSRKEGDNKALVEAMFANVPAVVYKHTVGGAGSRINSATGIFADDDELTDRLLYMLDHYVEFTPRAWVLNHSGSANTTATLNSLLERTLTALGGRFTEGIVEKTNSPNLSYKDPSNRARFEADYAFIINCRRESVNVTRYAVA